MTQSGYYERFWNNAQSLIGLTQDFSELITPGLTANVKLSFDAQNYNWIRRKKQVQTFTASKRDEEGNIIYTEGNVGQDNLDYSKGNNRIYNDLYRGIRQTITVHSANIQ